jgi:hypothetical protein
MNVQKKVWIFDGLIITEASEAKPEVPYWGVKSTLAEGQIRQWHRVACGKCVGFGL